MRGWTVRLSSCSRYRKSGQARGIGEVEGVAGPGLNKLPQPQAVKPLERKTVTPRFKKGGKQ